ncbi:MAG TPA: glycosyltransferase family 9 protein [Gemmataceae bacterium]
MALGDLRKASPQRVVVLRALKLGDLLCAVPTFRALRTAWPEAEIVLLGLPWAQTFVERYRCYLDGFRVFPGFPGLPEREPDITRLPLFLREMQEERFDLAIQLHGSGSFVNPLIVLLGAKRSAGFYLPGEYCPDPKRFCPWPTQGREVSRLLQLVECLGLPLQGDHLDFPLGEEDFQALERIEGTEELRPGEYVCLHPGASVPERRWPLEWFAGVGAALARRGLRLVLTGEAREAELTAAVARSVGVPVLNLAGRTDLGALAALLSRARLLVCNDTGVSHVADALRLPSIVLSTGDNPARWGPADRRLHRVFTDIEPIRLDDLVAETQALLDEPSAASLANKN